MNNKILNIIKNIAISFIALVFIMGFFSQSIVNLFLPKVKVSIPKESAIERTVNVIGEVKPKETLKVRLGGNVIVKEYYLNKGDEVKKGDPIFRIDTNYGLKNDYGDLESLKIELEKEKLNIDRLKNKSYIIDKKSIDLLETKLKKNISEFEDEKKLFKEGAITKKSLDMRKISIEELKTSLEIEIIKLKEKKSENEILIKEAKNKINKLQSKIKNIENNKNFYSNISDDGIYYSKTDGVILKNNEVDKILYRDKVITEVAKTNGLKYVANFKEEDYNIVNNARRIRLENVQSLGTIRVVNISQIVNDNILKLEAEFDKDYKDKLIIGQKIKGEIVKSERINGTKTISRSSIIPNGELKEGSRGKVYIVEKQKGILGEEKIVKEVEVNIKGVGDKSVIVTGLESYKKPKVILNLSYRIQDGKKVFIWD
ncbi:MAG: hypothetical protein FH751_16485 [Firmicutes bacterium]|nr:hypothetical protein [Bacillota bacterium]